MSTVTRQEFVSKHRDAAFDVNKAGEGMSAAVAKRIRAADLDGNGQIQGSEELHKAFTALDTVDRDGSYHSIKLNDRNGRALPAAQNLSALEQARTTPAPRRGIGRDTTSTDAVTGPIKGDVMGTAKGTGYYPHNSKMEGGYNDMRGKKLNTLQDFLDGKSPHVSIALDKKLYRSGAVKYGDTFRIPELEKKYGRPITFKAVDTGGAFTDKGFSRVDICTGSQRDSVDATVNGRLTLVRQ